MAVIDDFANALAAVDIEDTAVDTTEDVGTKNAPNKHTAGAANADDTAGAANADDTASTIDNAATADEDITWGKALGLDDSLLQLDEAGNFKGIMATVNGQSEVVDLPALVAGWQNNKANTIKSQALAEERRVFEAARVQAAQEYAQKVSTLETLTKHMADKLVGEAKNIDWDRLRVENPGEYAARVQDFNLKQLELQQVLQMTEQERVRLEQEAMGQQNERIQAFTNEQAKILIQNNPEWKNPEKMNVAFQEMSKFATETYGFSKEDFNSVVDARLFSLLQDAMKYRQGVKVADNKVIAPVPKFTKSSGKGAAQPSKLQVLTQKARTATGAAKRAAQTDAIAELLLTGR